VGDLPWTIFQNQQRHQNTEQDKGINFQFSSIQDMVGTVGVLVVKVMQAHHQRLVQGAHLKYLGKI
jgi:hypothetical protein